MDKKTKVHPLQALDHFQIEVNNDKKSLEHAGSTLTIMQITDLHQWPRGYNEFVWGPNQLTDLKKAGYDSSLSIKLIEDVCDKIKPEVVILTGDILDSRPLENFGTWQETFNDVVQPLIDRKIYWSFVPGNHDHDNDNCPYKRNDLLKIYQMPYCLSKNATSFNHTLTIGPTATCKASSSIRLWLFDSGINSTPDIRYTTFHDHVIKDFLDLSPTLNPVLTSLVFFHIPLPEYEGLSPLVGSNGLFNAALGAQMVPFPWNWLPGVVRVLGKDRIAGCSKLNSGMYDALLKDKSILATFCGHDHHSDAVFKREQDPLYMCYGRCGSFTPPSNWEGKAPNEEERGHRIIEIPICCLKHNNNNNNNNNSTINNNNENKLIVSTWIELQSDRKENSLLHMTQNVVLH